MKSILDTVRDKLISMLETKSYDFSYQHDKDMVQLDIRNIINPYTEQGVAYSVKFIKNDDQDENNNQDEGFLTIKYNDQEEVIQL